LRPLFAQLASTTRTVHIWNKGFNPACDAMQDWLEANAGPSTVTLNMRKLKDETRGEARDNFPAGHGYEGPTSRVMAWSILLLACRDLAGGCGAPLLEQSARAGISSG
jgi:hypothetical protein